MDPFDRAYWSRLASSQRVDGIEDERVSLTERFSTANSCSLRFWLLRNFTEIFAKYSVSCSCSFLLSRFNDARDKRALNDGFARIVASYASRDLLRTIDIILNEDSC